MNLTQVLLLVLILAIAVAAWLVVRVVRREVRNAADVVAGQIHGELGLTMKMVSSAATRQIDAAEAGVARRARWLIAEVVRPVERSVSAIGELVTDVAADTAKLQATLDRIAEVTADTQAPRGRRVVTTDAEGKSHEGWLAYEDRHRLVLEDALEYQDDGSTVPVAGRLHLPAAPNRRTQDVTEIRGGSREGTA